jgi:hypothetical protein
MTEERALAVYEHCAFTYIHKNESSASETSGNHSQYHRASIAADLNHSYKNTWESFCKSVIITLACTISCDSSTQLHCSSVQPTSTATIITSWSKCILQKLKLSKYRWIKYTLHCRLLLLNFASSRNFYQLCHLLLPTHNRHRPTQRQNKSVMPFSGPIHN